MVCLGTFCNIDSSLTTFARKAEWPAWGFGSAFLLTILKGGNAFWIFLASGPLVWTFLLNALLGIGQGGETSCWRTINTFMIIETFNILSGIVIFRSVQAVIPASLCCVAFFVTGIKSSKTSSILLTCFILIGAISFNALSCGNRFYYYYLIHAVIFHNTTPN